LNLLTFHASLHVELVELVVLTNTTIPLKVHRIVGIVNATVRCFLNQFAKLRFTSSILLEESVLTLTKTATAHRVLEAWARLVLGFT
jgi:hypothetical protein